MSDQRRKRQTYNVPGEAHELTFSVYRRRKIMFEDGVVEAYLASLLAAAEKHSFDIWAYVVMPDHCHLLIYPREKVYDIGKIMASIKRPVAEKAFKLHPELRKRMRVKNPAKGETSRFWQQGGGYDRNMFTPEVIWAAIDYIHQNPVRKGFADSPLDWPWSSARFYEDLPSEIPVTKYSW